MRKTEYAAHRARLKMSHDELGKELGRDRSMSWRYENGFPIPPLVARVLPTIKPKKVSKK